MKPLCCTLLMVVLATLSAVRTIAVPVRNPLAPVDFQAQSSIRSFLPIVAIPCMVPQLKSPANDSVVETLKPTFGYLTAFLPDAMPKGGLSELTVAKDSSLSTVVLTAFLSSGDVQWKPSSSLKPGTRYFWKVKGPCGGSSEVWDFTTSASVVIPPSPTLLSPPSGASDLGLEVDLMWNAVAGAEAYEVVIYISQNSYMVNPHVTETHTRITGLSPDREYQWSVRTIGNLANSEESPKWRFRTSSATH